MRSHGSGVERRTGVRRRGSVVDARSRAAATREPRLRPDPALIFCQLAFSIPRTGACFSLAAPVAYQSFPRAARSLRFSKLVGSASCLPALFVFKKAALVPLAQLGKGLRFYLASALSRYAKRVADDVQRPRATVHNAKSKFDDVSFARRQYA